MTNFTGDGLFIEPQDLSSVEPESEDDGRTFHHDGTNNISLTGGVTSNQRGLYTWDADASAWYPMYQNADKIDGKHAGAFLQRDGSLAMEGGLDLGNNKLLNASEIEGGTGGVHLNTNHVELHSHTLGANFRFTDANGLLLVEAQEGGDVSVPNGQLLEQGNRVATRAWTNANADVPNADYADNAGSLGGSVASDFLHVSGDQMEGVLDLGGFDLNDGGTTKYDSTAGVFVQSALGGPASSLSSYPLSEGDISDIYVKNTGDTMSGNLGLATGKSIEDGSGTSRLDIFSSQRTFVRDGAGKIGLDLSAGTETGIRGYAGQPIVFRDEEGAFDAVKYTTSASAPGTLSLDNADLTSTNEIRAESNSYQRHFIVDRTSRSEIDNEFLFTASFGDKNGVVDEEYLSVESSTNQLINAYHDGDVKIPNGQLSEMGNRVATRTWASGSNILHSELADAPASAHHTRYADSEAVAAVNGEVSLSVDISGDANSVDGYDIQKNGTDGAGIINFKT